MSAFIDTNIIVRHLTGDPADMAARATTFLESASGLLLTDLVLAEAVYVLESFYHVPHAKVAEAMRSLIAFKAVITVDPALLLRALEVYEVDRLDFAEAYLVASAESSAVNTIVSYDKSIDRITTVERIEPPAIA
jgi:predicted nucleic acid-binding protein